MIYNYQAGAGSEEDKLLQVCLTSYRLGLISKVNIQKIYYYKFYIILIYKYMYLQRRNRILRQSSAIRSLVAETLLTPNDFIAPLFIDEGENVSF